MNDKPIIHVEGKSSRVMRTNSGRFVDIWDLKPGDIIVPDIAHALSNTCRWGGHIDHFYSVAEHSWRVLNYVLNYHPDAPPMVLMQALMHDAAEAYLVDVPRPIKYELTQYRELEKQLETAMFPLLGIDYPFDPIVKEADDVILRYEWDHFITPAVTGTHWASATAKTAFLDAYHHLEMRILADNEVQPAAEQA